MSVPKAKPLETMTHDELRLMVRYWYHASKREEFCSRYDMAKIGQELRALDIDPVASMEAHEAQEG